MSRHLSLTKALSEKKLFKLSPLPFPGDESVVLEDDDLPRQLYVSANVDAAVMAPFPDTIEGQRRGEFRAWLDDFMLGALVSVSEKPYDKPPGTDLARVAPVEDEFWSIRILLPEDTDGIRSLGAFHALDELIALRWEFREVIGASFDDEVDEVKQDWVDIFGHEKPHSGGSLDEYLTIKFLAHEA